MTKMNLTDKNLAIIIKDLQENGYLERVGSKKTGFWNVKK